jgi:hypothetical protein
VWLSLSVDHVIPVGSGKLLGYPSEWIQDTVNQVTCCRACNEFLNGYRVTDQPPATVDEFFKLRDRQFLAKRDWAEARHARERAWYDAAFAHPPAEPE